MCIMVFVDLKIKVKQLKTDIDKEFRLIEFENYYKGTTPL